MEQKNNSSPQVCIHEDKKGMQERKAEHRKLILKCWQKEILAPPNPAKSRTRGVRQESVKLANRGNS